MSRLNFHNLIANSQYHMAPFKVAENFNSYEAYGEQILELMDVFQGNEDLLILAKKERCFVELLLFGTSRLLNKQQFHKYEPIALLANLNETIYPGKELPIKVYRIYTLLLRNYVSHQQLREMIDEYIEESSILPSLFPFVEVGENLIQLKELKNAPFEHRSHLYEQVLNDPRVVSHYHIPKPFITSDHEHNRIYTTKGNRIRVKEVFTDVEYPNENLPPFKMTKLIEERKKVKQNVDRADVLNKIIFNEKTFEEMGQSYINRGKAIQYHPIDESGKLLKPTNFTIQPITHVAGPLGAGKSTAIHALAYSLTKQHRNQYASKLVFITGSTMQATQLMETFIELGLKAVIFTGKSNKSDYYQTFVVEKIAQYKDNPIDIFTMYGDIFESLDFTCLIENEMECPSKQSKPCSSIKMEGVPKGRRFTCPLGDRCGQFKAYEKLISADIWIGTYAAFFSARVPYFYDKYERPFFEVASLWADAIIMDEADELQHGIDTHFITEMNLISSTNRNDHYFFRHLMNNYNRATKLVNENRIVWNYHNRFLDADRWANLLYQSFLVPNTEHSVTRELEGTHFSLQSLIRKWVERYVEDDQDGLVKGRWIRRFNHLFKERARTDAERQENEQNRLFLEKYRERIRALREPSINPNASSRVRRDENVDVLEETIKILEEFLQEVPLRFNNRDIPLKRIEPEKLVKRNRMMEFILLFSSFQHSVYWLRSEYGSFAMQPQNEELQVNLDFMGYMNNQHQAYIPEALISTNQSFRIENENANPKQPHYNIKIVEYTGIGREFLLELPSLFGPIEDTSDPVFVLMSATSIAPNSNYFDIRVKPNWLLKNKDQHVPEVSVEVHLFSDVEGWIQTSGYSSQDERLRSISRLIDKMIETDYLLNLSKENIDNFQVDQEEVLKNIRINRRNKEEKTLWERKKTEVPQVVSLVASSFEIAELVGRKLVKKFGEDQVAVLFTPDKTLNGVIIEQQPYHITKTEVHLLYNRKIKFFVFVPSSIGRGYNILRSPNSDESLIYHQIWLSRPYPTPDHFDDMVMFLHGRLEHYHRVIERHQRIRGDASGYEAYLWIKGKSYEYINDLSFKSIFWKRFNEPEKLTVASNQLIPVIQTSGRSTRSMKRRPKAKIIFADSNVSPKTRETLSPVLLDETDDSILGAMVTILSAMDSDIEKELYGAFIKGFSEIVVKRF